ncbi:MAG: hypothetical protein WB562_12740 [Candidatus Sulfotelmatobacter sp.]
MTPQDVQQKAAPASSGWDYEVRLLAWLAVCVSVVSFLYYYRRGDVLLYGDAVAHINIARRVFDSKTPGLLQLGTVWLPLPHLLILPLVISDSFWQNGAGGSLPSMAAYVLGVVGIFRLARAALQRDGPPDGATRVVAWSAALVYGANPNLIYMQSTAMGEAVYLASFVWTVVHFTEFARASNTDAAARSLTKCGLCVAAASLTRYDGWFLAVVMVIGAAVRAFHPRKVREDGIGRSLDPATRKALTKFILIAAAGPALWLAYNAIVYRNPLEFANGPYSAKAIEQKTGTINPAHGNVWAAASYFLKAAELNVGVGNWQGRLWLALALLGSLVACISGRGRSALLLWVPLPFYALSVAYGSVPIFVPVWWPFSNYNLRYGLQLLPAFAVFVPLALAFLTQQAMALISLYEPSFKKVSWVGVASLGAILLVVAGSYGMTWRAEPVCYREALINLRGRIALEKQLASLLLKMPQQATLLMFLGNYVGALERAGIPLRRVINEGNHRVWERPVDPEGLWERGLADPTAYADYVVAFEGDRVWQAAKDRHLTALIEIHSTGQPRAIIFLGRAQGRAQ